MNRRRRWRSRTIVRQLPKGILTCRYLFPFVWLVFLPFAYVFPGNDYMSFLPLFWPFPGLWPVEAPPLLATIPLVTIGLGFLADYRGHCFLPVLGRIVAPIALTQVECALKGNPQFDHAFSVAWLFSVMWFYVCMVAHAVVPSNSLKKPMP
ncbi:MAG: hypothetical protein R3F20_09035 [Planctomycetota bacterium]